MTNGLPGGHSAFPNSRVSAFSIPQFENAITIAVDEYPRTV